MSDLETTQSKLRSTPTGGVDGEHSAYSRRLLSAGYKGYIQGMIGGATLYGTLGLIVGTVVLAPITYFVGPALLLGIPALGAVGMLHGAHAFADIGKTAAIIAESAEMNEKRRYLLDRYYETPSEEEAKSIKNLLETQMKPNVPEKMFHWKTVAVGAALGFVFVASMILLAASPAAGALGIETALPHIAHALGYAGAHTTLATLAPGVGGILLAIGTAVGTVAGGMIGLDREYIRRWLDRAEFTVHDQSKAREQIAAREREVNQLGTAAMRDAPAMGTNAIDFATPQAPSIAPNLTRAPIITETGQSLSDTPQPATSISTAELRNDARISSAFSNIAAAL